MVDNSSDLISLLPPDLKEKVEEGTYSVYPGQNPEKPVVLDEKGRLVKGSGRWPNANDPAWTGKVSGYKKSKSYREALETLVPLEGDEQTRGSFAWWIEQGMQAAEGSPQRIECPCGCEYKGIYAFKKDAQMIFKIIELLHGKAREAMDINVKSEQLVAILNERVPMNTIEVHTIDPADVERRTDMLKAPDNETTQGY